jgi:hypothetical protein
MIEFQSWTMMSGADPKGVLKDAFGVIEHTIKRDKANHVPWSVANYKLPLHLPSRVKSCVVSPAMNLPKKIDPFTEATEKLIIHNLIAGLNDKLGFGLDCDPNTNRAAADSTNECRDFVLIGGDHAKSVGAVLEAEGKRVQMVYLPNYRASAVHCGKMEEAMANITITHSTIIVIQTFDSGFFMVRTEEGSLIPACKRADGSLHIDGDLVMVNKDMQLDLFRQMMEELTEWKNNYIIFMAPLPKYLEAGCCPDEDHVGNRKQPDYKQKMEEAVFAARTNIKNFAFRAGLKKCHTVSTWGKVRKQQHIWVDQTTVSTDCYKIISVAIQEAAADLVKKRPAQLPNIQPEAKRPRAEAAARGRTAPLRGGSSSGRGGGQTAGREDHNRSMPGWIRRGRGGHPGGHGGRRGRY